MAESAMYIYVGTINPNLICCICRHPFVAPTSTIKCIHTFCRVCIDKALVYSPTCPVDRLPLGSEDLRSVHMIVRNLVDELLVECPNRDHGCLETPQRHLLIVHTRESCDYEYVSCTEPKCEAQVFRKDLDTHKRACGRRAIVCAACGEDVEFQYAEAHRLDCPQATISCTDCGQEMPRHALPTHLEECLEASIVCSQGSNGCPWSGPRKSLAQHTPSCAYEAIKGFFTKYTAETTQLRKENATLKDEMRSMRTMIHSLTQDLVTARQVLGPWFRRDGPAFSLPIQLEQAPQTPPPTDATRMTRRQSHPLSFGVLGLADRPSTDEQLVSAQATPPPNRSGEPSASNSASTSLLSDFNRLPTTQSPIPPINFDTSIEGSLITLRNSIVQLSTSLDSMNRRQDMNFTTELLRMHEEVGSLRAIVHGLRMQVHAVMMERNNALAGGGIGYTTLWDSASIQHQHGSPPMIPTSIQIRRGESRETRL